MRCYRIVIV